MEPNVFINQSEISPNRSKFNNPFRNLTKKQLATLLTVSILLIAIPVALYLVQRQQNLRSRAASEPISNPITIAPYQPPVVLSFTAVKVTTNTIQFNVSCKPATNSKIKGAIFHYGDNSPDYSFSYQGTLGSIANLSASHTYSAGNYTASIHCFDDGNYLSNSSLLTITVTNILPTITTTVASPSATITVAQGGPVASPSSTPRQITRIIFGNTDIDINGQISQINLGSFTSSGGLIFVPISVIYSDNLTIPLTIAFNYLAAPSLAAPSLAAPSLAAPSLTIPSATPSNATNTPIIPSHSPAQGLPQPPDYITALVDGVETTFQNNQVRVHLNGTANQPGEYNIFVIAKYGNLPLQSSTTIPIRIKYQPRVNQTLSDTPTNLQVDCNVGRADGTLATLSWTGVSTPNIYYQLRINKDPLSTWAPATPSSDDEVPKSPAQVTFYTTAIKSNTKNSFSVQAIPVGKQSSDIGVYTSRSDDKEFRCSNQLITLPALSNLTTNCSNGNLTVSWDKVTNEDGIKHHVRGKRIDDPNFIAGNDWTIGVDISDIISNGNGEDVDCSGTRCIYSTTGVKSGSYRIWADSFGVGSSSDDSYLPGLVNCQ